MAFLAVTHVSNPPGILLVEEPEKGIHHASLKLVVGTLQELAEKKNVQVILTTHSPFLLDWVEGSDVRVFAKTDDGGVRCAKLMEYPDVEKWKKHFMSGEIWTGLDEADVVAHHGGAK